MPAIYIHWPFCISKCPYCDFNSHVGDTSDQEVWRNAYRREMQHYAGLHPDSSISSIYFGGGTPSLMEARTVDSVLQDISRLWRIEKDAEITIEANPSSAETSKFADFRKSGVNRLSLGVQSLNDAALQFLGRAHNAREAKNAIALAEKHFLRFSFDMIYGYAGQTPDKWRQELREAISLANGHLSLYQLTIEPHSQFYSRTHHGEMLTASDEDAVTMYETTQNMTSAAGLPAYEISNHAHPGQESRHNLTYWHYEDYIGIGPGAHGRFVHNNARHATENIRAPDTWLNEVEKRGVGIKTDEKLDAATSMREAFMMGLRLTEGIDLDRWQKKFPTPLPAFLSAGHLARLEKEGLILQNEKVLRATPAGLQRLNAVLSYLLNSHWQ
ncbi:MAG: radical SAM family heme chaperone HemW [Bdellovibrionales bacterium]